VVQRNGERVFTPRSSLAADKHKNPENFFKIRELPGSRRLRAAARPEHG
jgi:hypothetical protein